MSSTINNLCDDFNGMIGRISQTLIKDSSKKEFEPRAPKKFDESEGLFSTISKGLENVVIGAENLVNTAAKALDTDYQMEKAFMAHNIKATIYNVGTILAIIGLVTTIFNPIGGLVVFAASIAGRMFVDRAMERTWWGAIGNNHQVTDNSVYSLLFKSYLSMPTRSV
ncbi:MAG: hypothetical protein H0U49_03095 [Parachlamydiaceae bacterium]|nr:hypothetical protein [Parachlamydiaceae bacterium]